MAEELELRVVLLVDEAGKFGEIQRQLDAQAREQELTKREFHTKESDVGGQAYDCVRWELHIK